MIVYETGRFQRALNMLHPYGMPSQYLLVITGVMTSSCFFVESLLYALLKSLKQPSMAPRQQVFSFLAGSDGSVSLGDHMVQEIVCNVGMLQCHWHDQFLDGWDPTHLWMVMVMGNGANGIAIPTLFKVLANHFCQCCKL